MFHSFVPNFVAIRVGGSLREEVLVLSATKVKKIELFKDQCKLITARIMDLPNLSDTLILKK